MIWFRRNNGEFKPLKNSRYLPAYYFIPKEILDRNPAPLREIPRSFSKLMKDEENYVESNFKQDTRRGVAVEYVPHAAGE